MKKLVLLLAVCFLFGTINIVEAKVITQPNTQAIKGKFETSLNKNPNDGLIKHRDRTPNNKKLQVNKLNKNLKKLK